MMKNVFVVAQPVWPEALCGVKNATAGFRAIFEASKKDKPVLRVAGASLYRVRLNGEFLAHGPARTAHGFARVDEIPLGAKLRRGKNVLSIEVAGYCIDTYYLPRQAAFLCAEIEAGGKIVAHTSPSCNSGFAATPRTERLVKTQRFSFQRTFVEEYRMAAGADDWAMRVNASFDAAPCCAVPPPQTLPRGVPYNDYAVRHPVCAVAAGTLTPIVPEKLWKDRMLANVVKGGNSGYTEDEQESALSEEIQCFKSVVSKKAAPKMSGTLAAREWTILDFGVCLTGFIGLRVRCRERARIILTFDELLTRGDVDFKRLSCVSAVAYTLEPGDYALETIEPYELRYLKIQVVEGVAECDGVFLRELANPDAGAAQFACDDAALNLIFEAGRNTFRQNATDIFMDCPSRERAGWLCDSLFASRVETDLCGHGKVDRNFLENFLLPDAFDTLPHGMLPMCYPADHPGRGCFIPNFAMWFVLQLEEHLARTGDRTFVDAFEPKIVALFDYVKTFHNADGLLEKLESWVFVEWSKAADYTQDVSYPTNMLYAGALDAAGRIFGNRAWREQAAALRETIRRQSFDGVFFVDNAVRKNGRLGVTRNRSETCQYYAFFFNLATPETHPELWRKLVAEFGPCRAKNDLYPDICPSNALIGSDLRIEVLSRYNETRRLLRDVRDYRLPMAKTTGTLWEHLSPEASCNHGFASHTCHVLLRDALGVAHVDIPNKRLYLVLTDNLLKHCSGTLPAGTERLTVAWRKETRKLILNTTVPQHWRVTAENRSGLTLVWNSGSNKNVI